MSSRTEAQHIRIYTIANLSLRCTVQNIQRELFKQKTTLEKFLRETAARSQRNNRGTE